MDNEQVEELLDFITEQQFDAQSEEVHNAFQKVYDKIIKLTD